MSLTSAPVPDASISTLVFALMPTLPAVDDTATSPPLVKFIVDPLRLMLSLALILTSSPASMTKSPVVAVIATPSPPLMVATPLALSVRSNPAPTVSSWLVEVIETDPPVMLAAPFDAVIEIAPLVDPMETPEAPSIVTASLLDDREMSSAAVMMMPCDAESIAMPLLPVRSTSSALFMTTSPNLASIWTP